MIHRSFLVLKNLHLWHGSLLLGARNLRHPADTLWGIQLKSWLCLVDRLDVVHDSDLDDLGALEGGTVTEESAAAVSTEVRDNLVSRVCLLGELLWRARRHLEAIFWDDDVGRVGAAGDLAAVDAVAQGLSRISMGWSSGLRPDTTHLGLDITSVLDLDLATEATSGRHDDD